MQLKPKVYERNHHKSKGLVYSQSGCPSIILGNGGYWT